MPKAGDTKMIFGKEAKWDGSKWVEKHTGALMPLTSPPKSKSQYVDMDAYANKVNAGYTPKIKKFQKYKVGTWKRDPMKGIHGHEISELRKVKISDLELPELHKGELTVAKRGHDVEYAERIKKGHEAPPIEVVQKDNGGLRVIDGHRRVLAHSLAGRSHVKAWVSYAVDHPEGLKDSAGKIMKTGLTHEIAHGSRVRESIRAIATGTSDIVPEARNLLSL